jgi:exosortase
MSTVGLALVSITLLYGIQGNAQEADRLGSSTILWMVQRWSGSGGDLSHGWIIPLVSAYLIWRKRNQLAAAHKHPCVSGLVVVACALILHWVGFRAQLTRLSLLSMILVLWGIPLALFGRAFARQLVFPCAYLLLCIPLSFLDGITVPLRIFASTISTVLLNGLGIEAMQSGTAIYSRAGGGFNFDVADACSGLRSLLAMTALTAAYAYLTQDRLWKQWALFLSAVPLAMLGNIVRIVTIALIAVAFGTERAMKVYHDYSPFIVFAVAILAMTGIGRLLQRPKPEAPIE